MTVTEGQLARISEVYGLEQHNPDPNTVIFKRDKLFITVANQKNVQRVSVDDYSLRESHELDGVTLFNANAIFIPKSSSTLGSESIPEKVVLRDDYNNMAVFEGNGRRRFQNGIVNETNGFEE